MLLLVLMLDIEKKNAVGNIFPYREEMRNFVIRLSSLGKKENPGFIVIPQNALETLTMKGKPDGELHRGYISAIDGIGCEDLFFGLPKEGMTTPKKTTEYLLPFLIRVKKLDLPVFVIDYTKGEEQAGISRELSHTYGFISFQAERSLSQISEVFHDMNDSDILKLSDAKNFLFLTNGHKFRSREHFIFTMEQTNWDVLIIDSFFQGKPFTAQQIRSLKKKMNGKRRLVISYLSIGEAEDYRYYWRKSWKNNPPGFIERENQDWKGNYKVRYWMKEWKEIIYGDDRGPISEGSYLKKILNAGFDGVYLDIIDAADYFENKEK